jgi:hypothetical protein
MGRAHLISAKVRKNALLSRPSLGTDVEVGKRRPQFAFDRAATLADYPPRDVIVQVLIGLAISRMRW